MHIAERQSLTRKTLTDRALRPGDGALQIVLATHPQPLPERRGRVDLRDGHQMPAAKPAYLALDASLLMGALPAGKTERSVKAAH